MAQKEKQYKHALIFNNALPGSEMQCNDALPDFIIYGNWYLISLIG